MVAAAAGWGGEWIRSGRGAELLSEEEEGEAEVEEVGELGAKGKGREAWSDWMV